MGLVNKLLAGTPDRKSRLHDMKGSRVSLSRLARNGPRAVVTGIARTVFDRRPARPWISYDFQDVIAQRLTRQARVLEFGSGMSTMWYARRSGSVVSIEHDRAWFGMLQDKLPANVEYRFAETLDAYLDFPRQPYDLIMVDGKWRKECIETALPLLAPGGTLYLDNSDKEPKADAALLALTASAGFSVQKFVDFVPTTFFATEGTMVVKQ